MERVTFHCGEAFPHLLTGLRSMDDARRLLELRKGDRIGHGTALGMDPTYWREHQGESAYLRKEDRMLDLLYALESLKHCSHIPGGIPAKLEDELRELAHQVFSSVNHHIDFHILKAAMDMRGLNPYHLEQIFSPHDLTPPCSGCKYRRDGSAFSFGEHCDERQCGCIPDSGQLLNRQIERFKEETKSYLQERGIGIWDEQGELSLWEPNPELELALKTLKKAPSQAIRLLLDWQFNPRTWTIGEQVIRVALNKEDDEILLTLQKLMMQDFYDAGIIIETLITSNLRIASYRCATDHHAMRWLLHSPDKFKNEPDLLLCFGSDDPAVFSCDAKADFYLLYSSLHKHGVKEQDALRLLEHLNERGRVYSFPAPTRLSADSIPEE